jgi:hypothetical protein
MNNKNDNLQDAQSQLQRRLERFEQERETTNLYIENLKKQLEQERDKFHASDQQVLSHRKERIGLQQ